jgi:hypothetical protein
MTVPVMLLNSSPDRWADVPFPEVEYVYLPGLALSSATSWLTLVAGMDGLITSMLGWVASIVIGSKSLIGSYGSLE